MRWPRRGSKECQAPPKRIIIIIIIITTITTIITTTITSIITITITTAITITITTNTITTISIVITYCYKIAKQQRAGLPERLEHLRAAHPGRAGSRRVRPPLLYNPI